MEILRITGGRVIDPSQGVDAIGDLWIRDGRIVGSEPPLGHPDATHTIDADGLMVVPGLIDAHVHLREPGDEASETIETGTRAALESGFTGLAAMPDTDPAVDDQAAAEFIHLQARRAGHCNVWPVGAVTKNREGAELAEMGGLIEGGAVAFTDSPRPIADADIMRRALQYTQMFGKPLLDRPFTPELVREGIMNEGFVSMVLGLNGMPVVAEEIMVARDLRLARWTRGRLHLQCLSCADSVKLLREAKALHQDVTAEVCPHHLALTDDSLRTFDGNFKVDPPLRPRNHVDALIEGVIDGSIDMLVSAHSPCAPEQKLRELDVAPFGMIGVETLLPIAIHVLIEPGHIGWDHLVRLLSTNPARMLGIDRGTLAAGAVADVTLIDPSEPWTIDPQAFRSKSRNCPFAGWDVRGRASAVLVDGVVKFARDPSRLDWTRRPESDTAGRVPTDHV